jgi:hypothetical protein
MTIKDELLALKNEDGILIVENVWDWAKRNPDSKTHRAITWDVQKAAKEYQFHQIRRLIVLHVVNEEKEPEVLSLSIDQHKPKGGYRDIKDVMESLYLRQIALDDALRDLTRMQEKYQHLKDLAEVWPAVDKVRAKTRPTEPEPPEMRP